MTAALTPQALDIRSAADRALGMAAGLWFAVALIGQWAFVYYIASFYGPSTFSGNFQAWSRNANLAKGYVAGDLVGNVFFGAHALMAAVIAFGGAMQLVPQLRARAPALHRWNGRLFMLTALGVALSGLYLIWVRGSSPTFLGAMATSLNGVLIIACVSLAWRAAVIGRVGAHRRWALRAWIVANGQWFFRVGVFAVAVLDRRLIEPFFVAWGFGCTLAPLAVLELYLWVRDRGAPGERLLMASGLVALTALTGLGIVGVYLAMWRPLLGQA